MYNKAIGSINSKSLGVAFSKYSYNSPIPAIAPDANTLTQVGTIAITGKYFAPPLSQLDSSSILFYVSFNGNYVDKINYIREASPGEYTTGLTGQPYADKLLDYQSMCGSMFIRKGWLYYGGEVNQGSGIPIYRAFIQPNGVLTNREALPLYSIYGSAERYWYVPQVDCMFLLINGNVQRVDFINDQITSYIAAGSTYGRSFPELMGTGRTAISPDGAKAVLLYFSKVIVFNLNLATKAYSIAMDSQSVYSPSLPVSFDNQTFTFIDISPDSKVAYIIVGNKLVSIDLTIDRALVTYEDNPGILSTVTLAQSLDLSSGLTIKGKTTLFDASGKLINYLNTTSSIGANPRLNSVKGLRYALSAVKVHAVNKLKYTSSRKIQVVLALRNSITQSTSTFIYHVKLLYTKNYTKVQKKIDLSFNKQGLWITRNLLVLSSNKSMISYGIALLYRLYKYSYEHLNIALLSHKYSTISKSLSIKWQSRRNTTNVLNLKQDKANRSGTYITQSYTEAVPTWPTYLDGNLQFWEPQPFEYLDGNLMNIEANEYFNTEASTSEDYNEIDPYDFSDVDNIGDVVFHGKIDLRDIGNYITINGIIFNPNLRYQVIDNIQILRITEAYYVYTIVDSSSYGDILLKPAPLKHNENYIGVLNAETTFVLNLGYNRQYHIQSITNTTVQSRSNIVGTWPTYNSNHNILPEDFIAILQGYVSVAAIKLPVIGNLNVIRGGENIYYDANGFYYFETPPLSEVEATPIVSFANAINGDYSTSVSVVASSYDPGVWKLNGVAIDILSTTIVQIKGALINATIPVIIKKRASIATIYTTNNFNTIEIARSEAKLAGRIIINGIDYWATMVWKHEGVYNITSYSLISDLTKLATKELIVGKEFNKYS
jgi:hypothetical protein